MGANIIMVGRSATFCTAAQSHRIDLNLLLVLDAVYRSGSVTAAARDLNLSQPAVSKRLNHLRRLFSDRLFIRSTSGVDPTPTAHALAGPIGLALDSLRRAVDYEEAFVPAASSRTFRLFMSDLAQMVVLPRLVSWSARAAPLVKWDAASVPAGNDYTQALSAGKADLAIGYFAHGDESLRCQTLFIDPYVGVVRSDHPVIRDGISFEQFLRTPHLMYRPVGGGHNAQDDFIDRAFVASNADRRVAIFLAHAGGLAGAIRRTDALAILPRALAEACTRTQDVSLWPLPVDLPKVQVSQYWHARHQRDPAHRWMRRALAQIFQSAATTEPL